MLCSWQGERWNPLPLSADRTQVSVLSWSCCRTVGSCQQRSAMHVCVTRHPQVHRHLWPCAPGLLSQWEQNYFQTQLWLIEIGCFFRCFFSWDSPLARSHCFCITTMMNWVVLEEYSYLERGPLRQISSRMMYLNQQSYWVVYEECSFLERRPFRQISSCMMYLNQRGLLAHMLVLV